MISYALLLINVTSNRGYSFSPCKRMLRLNLVRLAQHTDFMFPGPVIIVINSSNIRVVSVLHEPSQIQLFSNSYR